MERGGEREGKPLKRIQVPLQESTSLSTFLNRDGLKHRFKWYPESGPRRARMWGSDMSRALWPLLLQLLSLSFICLYFSRMQRPQLRSGPPCTRCFTGSTRFSPLFLSISFKSFVLHLSRWRVDMGAAGYYQSHSENCPVGLTCEYVVCPLFWCWACSLRTPASPGSKKMSLESELWSLVSHYC